MELGILTLIAAAAFLAGLIDSIAGGGGLITTPALLVVGVPAQMALGTNKFQSMFGTASAVINFHRNQKINWKVAVIGIPAALVGSAVGAKLAMIVAATLLAKIIVIALPPVSAIVFLSNSLIDKRKFGHPHGARHDTERSTRGKRSGARQHAALLTLLSCFTIGLYDGFFGPGTGTFLIVVLVLIVGLSFTTASATAKTFNLASNMGAFFVFLFSGQINFKYAIVMAVANIGGNLIGSHLTIKHGDIFVRKILMVSLTILFVYLIVKIF